MRNLRIVLSLMLVGVSSAYAQLTVTNPSSGDVLGKTNQIRFLIENLSSQARVVATATNDQDSSVKFTTEGFFDPDSDKRVLSNLDLNFDETSKEGTYTLVVQYLTQGTIRETKTINNLRLDVRNPRFRNLTPGTNTFVSGIVPIRAELEESNMDRWRVRVNDRDIPNNTGTNNFVSVDWNPSNIEDDGQVSISLKVDDQAKNTATRNITVTLDRAKPTSAIQSPSTAAYRPTAVIPVVIEIKDQYTGSVLQGGVDVRMVTLDGQFLGKVARKSASNADNGLRWIGRIKATRNLPKQFKIQVTAVDRAGNRAQIQEVTVTIAGR